MCGCLNTHADLAQAGLCSFRTKNNNMGSKGGAGLFPRTVHIFAMRWQWLGEDKVSYVKQEDLKGHPEKGGLRQAGELLVFGFSTTSC